MLFSRKDFKKNVMPQVGDMIENDDKVYYINYGKFRFTAGGQPEMSKVFDLGGRLFKVVSLDPSKKRFNADFIGFKEAEAPTRDVGVGSGGLTGQSGLTGPEHTVKLI